MSSSPVNDDFNDAVLLEVGADGEPAATHCEDVLRNGDGVFDQLLAETDLKSSGARFHITDYCTST